MGHFYYLTARLHEWLPSLRRVRRLVAARLADAAGVLEIGCGIGGNARLLSGDYLGVDLDRRLLEQAERRSPDKHFQLQDAATLDAPDRGFESVLLTLAVHELHGREEVLRAAARLAARRILIVDYAPDLPARIRRRLAWMEGPELTGYWELDLVEYFKSLGWRIKAGGRVGRWYSFWEFRRSDEPV